MKNSLKLAMYEVVFKSGIVLSIISTQKDVVGHALGRNQDETLQDINSVEVSFYL